MVITIFVLIFVANFILPSLSEKMICEMKGGYLDKMFSVCALDPKICEDAGGAPIQVHGKCKTGEHCGASYASTIGCKFE